MCVLCFFEWEPRWDLESIKSNPKLITRTIYSSITIKLSKLEREKWKKIIKIIVKKKKTPDIWEANEDEECWNSSS